MQEDFKVGDRVEMTGSSRGLKHYTVGELGNIHRIDTNGWPLVYFDVDDGESYVNPNHLEKLD